MQVNVENGLTGVAVGIEHGPVALVRIPVLFCDSGCGSVHRSDQCIVVGIEIVEGADVPAGNDQRMEWRLGIDVPNSYQFVILINESTWDLSRDDLAEETVAHWR
jgi:hypothetical protein